MERYERLNMYKVLKIFSLISYFNGRKLVIIFFFELSFFADRKPILIQMKK